MPVRKKRDIILHERYIQARFYHLIRKEVCLLRQGYGEEIRDENEARLFAIGYPRWDAGILANSMARLFKRRALANKGKDIEDDL
jgi:putative AlgH/UPF0301 family transcriptional regulator